MLKILICDDDFGQRAYVEKVVQRQLILEDYDVEFTIAVDNPHTLLDCVKQQQIQRGLYFLDVDLQSDLHGFELATEIRKLDISASIVFVTVYANLVHQVFKYKVEAMDYIVKSEPPEDIERRIAECIKFAYSRYLKGKHSHVKLFTVKTADQIFNVPYDDILFFETSTEIRNKMVLHTENSDLEFYSPIDAIEALGSPFFRSHISYVVNLKNIVHVDKSKRVAKMTDGTTVPIAIRRVAKLVESMKELIDDEK